MTENRRIDLHYHIIPGPYVQALAKRGIHGSTYVKFPRWTPQTALKHLDRTQVRTAITSLSTPGVWFGDAALAKDLSRLCNEFQAEMTADHPERFGALATLPLPDVDLALRELEYALDTLKHDGVCLLSDVEGRYLGHPDLEELFAELDRRGAVVFIHPHDDPRTQKRYGILSPLLEWPIHTTRTAMDLLYSGRLTRYPNIRYVLAHGGGVLPFLAHRIVEAYENPASGLREAGVPTLDPVEARAALRRLFLDTAAPGEGHFAALQEFTSPSQLVFGTDGGWTPPIQTKLSIQALLDYRGFDEEELASIECRNAQALFPRFGGTESEAPVERSWRNDHPARELITVQEDETIDVHHHMIPRLYRDALVAAGLEAGDLPAWSPEESLDAMERNGTARALLSLPAPGVWLGRESEARRLARECNEWGASLKTRYPDRFGCLASLPFPDLEGSVAEVTHALDTLQLDGVILLSNVGGHYVGDPEFEPLLAELDRRNAMVLLHPNALDEEDPNAPPHPWTELPLDLTRAYARLVLNEEFVRYPRIRWILTHAGGGVPFLAERLGRGHYLKGGKMAWGRILWDLLRKGNSGLDLARRVSYEVAEPGDEVVMAALRPLLGPGRILTGTNYPWISPVEAPAGLREREILR